MDLKPKWDQHQRGKKKTIATIQYDLGSKSRDVSKVIDMGLKGQTATANTSSFASTYYVDRSNDETNSTELFHLHVIPKHTKIDTLIDSES